MKSYNPNMYFGIHIIEITLQQWEYVGHITQEIHGNCKGREVIDFDFECKDGNLENDCSLKFDENNDFFSAILKDSRGNTLEVEGRAEDFNKMIVKVEIISFKRVAHEAKGGRE